MIHAIICLLPLLVIPAVSAGTRCSGSGRLSEEERQLILDEHNKYRSLLAKGQVVAAGNQLLRGARNMIKLTYDCNLETIAQNWINYCQFEHSDREFRKGAGENLYYAGTTGELNNRTQYLKDAAKAWWDEVKDIYESSLEEEKGGLKMTNAISYAGALHWSQMAWAKTMKVGCGMQKCYDGNMKKYMVSCNYQKAGNMMGDIVFLYGNGCSKDSDCKLKKNNKCDVETKLCYKP